MNHYTCAAGIFGVRAWVLHHPHGVQGSQQVGPNSPYVEGVHPLFMFARSAQSAYIRKRFSPSMRAPHPGSTRPPAADGS